MRVEKKTKHLRIEFIVTSHNSVSFLGPNFFFLEKNLVRSKSMICLKSIKNRVEMQGKTGRNACLSRLSMSFEFFTYDVRCF